MAYEYNPGAQDMRDAYSVAYGDLGDTMLLGAMFARLTKEEKENIYATALHRVAQDMAKQKV